MPEEIILDVRDLEPPEPFERATETLRFLQQGQYVKLLIPRQPRLLYPWLTEHGFLEITREVDEDMVEVYIWHGNDRSCAETIADLVRD